MTNNTPDYNDNLYFDCKHCKMTDEYCASGDCQYDILKEYEAHKTPVPSYDEWKQAQERLSKLEKMKYSYTPEEWNIMLKTVNHTREENAQLKELLKEVLRHELSLKEVSELSRKISEALK